MPGRGTHPDPAGAARAQPVADEAGWVTPLGLFVLALVLLLVGVAIDTANLHRSRSMLQGTADIAAHAGASVLARGMAADTARAVAAAAVEANLPSDRFGTLVADPARDIVAVAYDPATGRIDRDGPANAIYARLQRNDRTANPLPTLVLRLAGIGSLDVATAGLAAIVPTRRCSNAEGLYAFGRLAPGERARPGGALCLHGQGGLDLPADLDAGAEVRLSAPRLPRDRPLPAVAAGALAEMNIVMPEIPRHLAALHAAFTAPGTRHPAKAAFFAAHPFDRDPVGLRNLGVEAWRLQTGSVIAMSPLRFGQLGRPPRGLVYLVTCATAADAPVWRRTLVLRRNIATGGAAGGPLLSGIALITTCPILLEPGVVIEDALILSLKPADGRPAIAVMPQSGPLTDAETGARPARLGAPRDRCPGSAGTHLMALDALRLEADLVGAGVTLVSAGDVTLLPDAAPVRMLHGLTVHAGGAVALAAGTGLMGCGRPNSPLLPALNVITQVMTGPDALPRSAPRIGRDGPMPGRRPDALPDRLPGADAGAKADAGPGRMPGPAAGG